MDTHTIDTVPPPKRACLSRAIELLRGVDGVVALVLGGSYARGTHHPGSDVDLGIYYSEAAPFRVAAIAEIAAQLTAGEAPVVTDFYEWGPWVNGGAWIETAAGKLDFLYRSVGHVERTIQEAHAGLYHHHYGQQPPLGFYSVTYLGETRVCVPLFDPQGVIARLKNAVARYPSKLKHAIVADALWGAEFTLLFARKFAAGGDVVSTASCLCRVAAHLAQALYALNETYFISDKGAVEATRGFKLCPAGYADTLPSILAQAGDTAAQLMDSVETLSNLWRAVVALPGTRYRAKYQLG